MSTPLPLPSRTAVSAPGIHSLPSRIAGVLRAPRVTFAAITRSPRWADVLALTFGVTFLCTAVLFETETGRLALVDHWERGAIAFGQPVDDARYASLARASEHGLLYAGLIAVTSGPVLVFGLSALLFVLFTGAGRGAATYTQVVAIVAHAGVILALRQLIAAPLDYARETIASPTTLNVFFSMLDEASPLARFLGIIDLFVVWWTAALAIGMAVLYGRRVRRLVAGAIGVYVAGAALLALVMALAGGTA